MKTGLKILMPKEKIKKIISENFLFKNFNHDEIALLVKHASFVSFNQGEFLLNAKLEAKNFYLILSGNVSLQIFSDEHGIVELESIQDGEFLGWSWLIPPYMTHFDVVAFEKTETISFDAKNVRKEMENNHEFGYKIFKLFAPIIIERLQASRANILELYDKRF